MIQFPGSIAREDVPAWLQKAVLMIEMRWTEEDYYNCSLKTRAELLALIAGRKRADEQKARLDEIRNRYAQ